jgi:hypothetical protein
MMIYDAARDAELRKALARRAAGRVPVFTRIKGIDEDIEGEKSRIRMVIIN